MIRKHSIGDECTVKSRRVLVLNRTIDPKNYNNFEIEDDGEIYESGLTHNEAWITADSDKTYVGKEVFL